MPSCFVRKICFLINLYPNFVTKEALKMKIKALISLVLCVAISLSTLASCMPDVFSDTGKDGGEPQTQAKSYYEFFDTVSVVISYKGDSAEEFISNCESVSSVLGDYHKLFDIYHEYAGVNNLMTVNKNAGKEPVSVDARLIDFLLTLKTFIYALSCIEHLVFAIGASAGFSS